MILRSLQRALYCLLLLIVYKMSENIQENKGVIISSDPIANNVKVCYYTPDFGPEELVWEEGTVKTFSYADLAHPFHFVGSLLPQAIEFEIGGQSYSAQELIELGWARFEADIHHQGFYLYWTKSIVQGQEMKYTNNSKNVQDKIRLETFDLSNIDEMRQYCLSRNLT